MVVVAASLGVYAVLVVVSLLGGPRLGAPLIPLPGGGPGVRAAAPVPGELTRGDDSDNLPSIPPQVTAVPSVPPMSTGPVDETGQPQPYGWPLVTNAPSAGPTSTTTSTPGDPGIGEPSRGPAERPLPSVPGATKQPPVPAGPTGTPQTSAMPQTPDGTPTNPTDPTDPTDPTGPTDPTDPTDPSSTPEPTPPTETPTEPPAPPESPSVVDALLDLVDDLLP
ncbi:hypothetical protein [Kribbella sp. CA-293567]|uniref:hypothetical protein n=1 Tax=Kribbella sp. CA-293567 TaxID=3002436 RepID=UPI0022DCF129|nr:hypothetical protein [Kribbella sp. CA-293567]WBQ06022.1 hypothetical protein OX958_04270 [Kribbella sp. CA-293567]